MSTEPAETCLVPVPSAELPEPILTGQRGICMSCGGRLPKKGRRYCSKHCRQHMDWVLSLSKGLLRTVNARYAAFSFTPSHVILDVLPVWSNDISRFIRRRAPARKPAEDLKRLVVRWGREWHNLVDNRTSRSSASLHLLTRNHRKELDPEAIKPRTKSRLRFSKAEREYMRRLKLTREDLLCDGPVYKVKVAYKRMAKRHHPDLGGDAEKFKQLHEAHIQMLDWAHNPQYTVRKALRDCWSYDGFSNRWSPPL